MNTVVEPSSETEFEKYFSLRFQVLRKPWNQPEGSERDEKENSSLHAVIFDDLKNAIAVGRLQFNDDHIAQIRFMAVKDEHRGKGLGTKVLNYLEEKAIQNQRKIIILQARENAVNFYLKNGYTVKEKSFLLFGDVQHYLMEKKL